MFLLFLVTNAIHFHHQPHSFNLFLLFLTFVSCWSEGQDRDHGKEETPVEQRRKPKKASLSMIDRHSSFFS
ncbi:MAG: hypothetical protein J3R72DRAFT_195199 [Linnemannia gamsii]|nr:MAG: hypothetical protein J3R72DRAFT_195199 [Linnemannia gamsii]